MNKLNFVVIALAFFVLTIACGQSANGSKDASPSPSPSASPVQINANNMANRDATSKGILDQLLEGSGAYKVKDYKAAIISYEKALDLAKKGDKIDKTWWIVLIDNLGMSYAFTNDLDKAKETFEYGISKDDSYPLFHYNLACTYAEMDNRDKAIEHLREAYKRKDNMIEGERFPDAASDSSFKKYMNDEKFTLALAEMKKTR